LILSPERLYDGSLFLILAKVGRHYWLSGFSLYYGIHPKIGLYTLDFEGCTRISHDTEHAFRRTFVLPQTPFSWGSV